MTPSDDTQKIAKLVRAAISDEWSAHFQYWIGSIIMSPRVDYIAAEFIDHANKEFEHATDLGLWLREVPRAATLPYALSELSKSQACGYIFPGGNVPESLLVDSMNGESCAIRFYVSLLETLSVSSYYGSSLPETVEKILADEREHFTDLERLLRTLPRSYYP